jgi:dTDP-4-amino-4,6-dideoxygalactose transaminase
MAEPIPFVDLRPDASLAAELEAAATRVLRSGRYVLGPEVEAFEREVAQFLGVPHAVGVSSGTDALIVSLLSLGVGAGDEVIVPAFGFIATPEAIVRVGARPVFVDIEPRSFHLDPARVDAALTPRTKAIVVVHLFGRCVDLEPLARLAAARGLKVVEDAAQAIGARSGRGMAGAQADVAAFSFFPTKTLGALGDGGLVTTSDERLAARARSLRVHGISSHDEFAEIGGNFRLDALQAALLRVKLQRLPATLAERRALAHIYASALADAPLDLPRLSDDDTFNPYVVRVHGDRDALRARLSAAGIETAIYYPKSLTQQPAFAPWRVPTPEADRAAREVLALPLRADAIDRIADVFSRR